MAPGNMGQEAPATAPPFILGRTSGGSGMILQARSKGNACPSGQKNGRQRLSRSRKGKTIRIRKKDGRHGKWMETEAMQGISLQLPSPLGMWSLCWVWTRKKNNMSPRSAGTKRSIPLGIIQTAFSKLQKIYASGQWQKCNIWNSISRGKFGGMWISL